MITVTLPQNAYLPGAELCAEVQYALPEPGFISLRLFYFTAGKGTENVEVVGEKKFAAPAARGREQVAFRLPHAPWSFSGELITLTWALEAVSEKAAEHARAEFVLSPSGREIRVAGRATTGILAGFAKFGARSHAPR